MTCFRDILIPTVKKDRLFRGEIPTTPSPTLKHGIAQKSCQWRNSSLRCTTVGDGEKKVYRRHLEVEEQLSVATTDVQSRREGIRQSHRRSWSRCLVSDWPGVEVTHFLIYLWPVL